MSTSSTGFAVTLDHLTPEEMDEIKDIVVETYILAMQEERDQSEIAEYLMEYHEYDLHNREKATLDTVEIMEDALETLSSYQPLCWVMPTSDEYGQQMLLYSDECLDPYLTALFIQRFLIRFRPEQKVTFEWSAWAQPGRVGDFGGGVYSVTAASFDWVTTMDIAGILENGSPALQHTVALAQADVPIVVSDNGREILCQPQEAYYAFTDGTMLFRDREAYDHYEGSPVPWEECKRVLVLGGC